MNCDALKTTDVLGLHQELSQFLLESVRIVVLTLSEDWPKIVLPIYYELPYGEVLRQTKEIKHFRLPGCQCGPSNSQRTLLLPVPVYLSPLPCISPPLHHTLPQLMLSAILCPKFSAVKGRLLKPAALLAFQQLEEHKSGLLLLLRLAPVVTWFWKDPPELMLIYKKCHRIRRRYKWWFWVNSCCCCLTIILLLLFA